MDADEQTQPHTPLTLAFVGSDNEGSAVFAGLPWPTLEKLRAGEMVVLPMQASGLNLQITIFAAPSREHVEAALRELASRSDKPVELVEDPPRIPTGILK